MTRTRALIICVVVVLLYTLIVSYLFESNFECAQTVLVHHAAEVDDYIPNGDAGFIYVPGHAAYDAYECTLWRHK